MILEHIVDFGHSVVYMSHTNSIIMLYDVFKMHEYIVSHSYARNGLVYRYIRYIESRATFIPYSRMALGNILCSRMALENYFPPLAIYKYINELFDMMHV